MSVENSLNTLDISNSINSIDGSDNRWDRRASETRVKCDEATGADRGSSESRHCSGCYEADRPGEGTESSDAQRRPVARRFSICVSSQSPNSRDERPMTQTPLYRCVRRREGEGGRRDDTSTEESAKQAPTGEADVKTRVLIGGTIPVEGARSRLPSSSSSFLERTHTHSSIDVFDVFRPTHVLPCFIRRILHRQLDRSYEDTSGFAPSFARFVGYSLSTPFRSPLLSDTHEGETHR